MRVLAVLLAICALVAASPTSYQGQRKYKLADSVLLSRQRDILRLFRYVNQPTFYKDLLEISKTYSIETNLAGYTSVQAVKQFVVINRVLGLQRGEIFSVFVEEHLRQAIALFRVLYYAKDYDTFYKTAAWARNYVNEGVFLYATSVAVVHREDTYGVVLPPIYEIYPYYFVNSETIEKAQQLKQQYDGTPPTETSGEFKGYTINTNWTGWYLNVNPEQSMSYFIEDVGLNAYYYYYNLYYPFWMGGEEFKLKNDRRGELFYYTMQQLLARYYMERLSNDFGDIPTYDLTQPIETGYYPSLRYPNGLEFTARPNHAVMMRNVYTAGQSWTMKGRLPYSFRLVTDYERRINDAIDRGYIRTQDGTIVDITTPQGIEILSNLIQSNPDSPNRRYYGRILTYARHLLGYSMQPLDIHRVAPSALQHFETSLRDPIMWQLMKRIVLTVNRWKKYIQPYNYDDLNFSGVKIDDVQIVDKLVTYMEPYTVDVTQSVWVTHQEFDSDTFRVRSKQMRLNHKPFTYRVNVVSEKATQGVVRVFLGPKYDEYDRAITVAENRLNFVEIDQFVADLQVGQNVIERNSRQGRFVTDKIGYQQLVDRVEDAIGAGAELVLDGSETYYGIPNRLLLPMGNRSGQTFQLYVIINQIQTTADDGTVVNRVPLQDSPPVATVTTPGTLPRPLTTNHDPIYPRVGTGGQYIDARALGYPFDRIVDEYNFFVPNSFLKDVVIYYKNADEINSSSQV